MIWQLFGRPRPPRETAQREAEKAQLEGLRDFHADHTALGIWAQERGLSLDEAFDLAEREGRAPVRLNFRWFVPNEAPNR